MKTLSAIILTILVVHCLTAGTLTNEEVQTIQDDIRTIVTRFNAGDFHPMIERTHKSIYLISGGKENFERAIEIGCNKIKEEGLIPIDVTPETPSRTYESNTNIICFCPYTSTMELDGEKIKSTAFMVAIREKESLKWDYLGGSGFSKAPETLYQLFPDLEKGIKLPPYKFGKI